MGAFFTRKGGGGINISANSYFFSFFSLCSSLDFSSLFPSCCPLTDKPRGRRERCWRCVRLCVPRYRLFCCFQEPPLKSVLLPVRITPATATGPRYLPAPPPGGTSLTSLLQASPSCPSHTSPYLLDQGLYGLFIEQRDSAARSVAGCCRRRSIHSAPCVSAPANPLCDVRAPAAPHALCFLSPPCPLDCPMISHSAGGCNDTLGSKGQERTCSTQVASFPPSRQQIRWYLPIPPPVQQHRCHLLSLGLGEHSSHSSYWVSHPRLSSRTALAAAIPAL